MDNESNSNTQSTLNEQEVPTNGQEVPTNGQYVQANKSNTTRVIIIIAIILYLLCFCGVGTVGTTLIIKSNRTGGISLSSEATMKDFINAADDNNWELYNRNRDSSYNSAYSSDYSVQCDLLVYDYSDTEAEKQFDFYKDLLGYYDYSAEDKHNKGDEVTFVKDDTFYDIAYKKHTLVVGIAYNVDDSYKVESFINNLGY